MSESKPLAWRLRDEPARSRNKHFEEMSRPEVMRARRSLRRLEGLKRELQAGGIARVRRQPEGYLLTIEFPAVRARRAAFLTPEEHDLLGHEVPLPAVADDG